MKASFPAKYARTRKILAKRLKAYLKDSSPENVRSLRIAIRRMSLNIELFPKKMRRERATQILSAALDQASKANAKVRDLDIVISKISTYKSELSIDNQIAKIKETRDSQLQAARRQTLALQKHPKLKVGEKGPSNVKLQKRLNKTSSQLILAINSRLPLVLQDSNNVRDLHLLRMDCRRLRYLAELFRSKRTARLLSRLRSWQDLLGFIHDSDLTVDYLRNLGGEVEMHAILNDLVRLRTQSYEKFGSIARQISPVTLVV